MSTEYGSIDDMLMGGTTPSIPQTPESKPDEYQESSAPDNDFDEPELESRDDFYSTPEEKSNREEPEESEQAEEPQEKEAGHDDYGNPKEKPRTYTEEEVNERINKAVRERLSRGAKENQQPAQPQTQQDASDFEYNPESNDSWQTQLEKFVETTVSKMSQKQARQQQFERDQEVQTQFEDKFTRGMGRFGDFQEVVGSQPVTDAMTHALRGVTDPAAFIYAASKRHPQELSRISQIQDPYAQIVEMGKLEERMKKASPMTRAPKPVSRSRDDGSMPTQKKKTEPSIEDLIANSDAKRRAQLNQKRGR